MKRFDYGFVKIGEFSYSNFTTYFDLYTMYGKVCIIETTFFDRNYDRIIEKIYNFRQWAQLAPLVKYDIKLISK